VAYGFVYLLGNAAMPGYYKIGKTERSPTFRAQQLSSSTGVPVPFQVLCYFESENCGRDETSLHHIFADFRVSSEREFFQFSSAHLPWVWGVFRHNPNRISFTECQAWDFINPNFTEINPWRERFDRPDPCEFSPDELDFDLEEDRHLRLVR
jgi:hypothetical protein